MRGIYLIMDMVFLILAMIATFISYYYVAIICCIMAIYCTLNYEFIKRRDEKDGINTRK